jgi:predicted nucleic acid-binding protein
MENVVFDTSAILNCGKKGECEFLLERLAEENLLFTTPEVERELRDPQFSHGTFLQKHFKIQNPKNFSIEVDGFPQLAAFLSSGELSVLLLALELNALAVVDDILVRKAAATLNIRFCSTFRILADGIRHKWCNDEQCTEIVNRLHHNGFKIRPRHANESLFEYLSADCS